MTRLLFRDDAEQRHCEATILAFGPDGAIVLDQTVFYAQGGGQPGDRGTLTTRRGEVIAILDTVYGEDKSTVLHRIDPTHAAVLTIGEMVRLDLDWPTRHARMRIHTALHLLTAVLPYPVTGGSIGDGEGRLDFDMPPGGPDRDAITDDLNALIARNADVTTTWITDQELEANPGLVKTMSVKPPTGSGRVRLVKIGDIDLQPCGGTHVGNTREIGPVAVTAIEKKGKQNRRVRIALQSPSA